MWRRRRGREAEEKRAAHGRVGAVRVELGQVRHALSIERGRVEHLENELRKARARLALAAEPARTECAKVRLHFKAEAERWREQIAADTDSPVEDLSVYDCRVCPRSPVTMRRYWHVGHDDPEAKAETMARKDDARRAAASEGRLIAQRLGSDVAAKLREIGRER